MSGEPLDAGGTPAPAPTVHFDMEPQNQSFDSTKDVVMHDKDESPELGQIECAPQTFLHSPPDSNNVVKSDPSDSELSDLEGDVSDPTSKAVPVDDIGDVEPDHYTDGVPVFKPTMDQFKDFKLFMEKVDKYGMKSGIIKICPPDQWRESQPPLDDLVKTIRVREPIKQEIMGSNGTYRQVNFVHGRVYTLRQWRELCEQSEHQPPSRRGERRMNFDRPKAPTRPKPAPTAKKPAADGTEKRRRGRPPKNRGKAKETGGGVKEEERPMTPVSDKQETEESQSKTEHEKSSKDSTVKFAEAEATPVATPVADTTVMESIEADPGALAEDEGTPNVRRMGAVRRKEKMQSTSARRKYSRREGSAMIDEAHFKGWDYKMDVSDFTRERCEELERIYWKTLTYAPPLYGADLMGTLFDDRTETWNLNKLPNLLDVLGTRVPGVNTAYLYLGMWKATFAWHLEDVDLYSINYLHFGAPKQWYSISQGDARRFEAAMKSIWPTEAKACDQFLRHKSFLISPSRLLQNYNIKVNKCVSYPGEFVVTYPYGYHSGYNLGYNCAEAVNFALDSWLPMGKIAKKCECAQAQDSVWVDVYDMERKLRGEETEYEETEDEEDEDDDEEDPSSLPTPPASHSIRMKLPSRKRKRAGDKDGKKKVKKVRLRVKAKAEPPCCLCPHEIPHAEILPTSDGRKAHRMCALYLPETYIETVGDKEVVENVGAISKERLELKCLYCRSKRGACFQCSQEKCTRSYHATCAAAAGVFVEEAEVPVFGEDGTEYKEQAFEFNCRFHRTKRDKRLDGDKLESEPRIRDAAKNLKEGDICQLQYYRGDIFAGVVVENRHSEETLLLDIIPRGYDIKGNSSGGQTKLTASSDRVEVEWKWLLVADAADYRLPKASSNAIPLPSSRKAKDQLNAKRADDEVPRKGSEFVPGYTWTEFSSFEAKNKEQAKVDMDKEGHVWYYMGKPSTDAKAQYTEDPSKPRHNPKANYLDTIPKPPKPVHVAAPRRPSMASSASTTTNKAEKPYVYKPRIPVDASIDRWRNPSQGYAATPSTSPSSAYTSQRFEPTLTPSSLSYLPVGMGMSTPAAGPSSSSSSNASRALPPQRTWPTQQATAQSFSAAATTASATATTTAAPTVPGQSLPQASPTIQNRDSHRFRTPYSQFGGYTNGYEGNLLAYLMKGGALFNGPQQTVPTPTTAPTSSVPGQTSPPLQTQHKPPLPTHMQPRYSPTVALPSAVTNPGAAVTMYGQPASTSPGSSGSPAPQSKGRDAGPGLGQLGQLGQLELKAFEGPGPLPTKTPKYKIPARESPVPLPAKYLAAFRGGPGVSPAGSPSPSTSTSTTPTTKLAITSPTAATTSALPAPDGPPAASSTTVKMMAMTISTPTTWTPPTTTTTTAPISKLLTNDGEAKPTPVQSASVQPASVQPAAPKISTTPVPLPPIPGLPRTAPVVNPAKGKAWSPQPASAIAIPSDKEQPVCSTIEVANHHVPHVPPPASKGPITPAVPSQPPATAPPSLDIDLPDVPADSSALMEKIMLNLRRASGTAFM